MKKKIIALIQARMGSARLPNKSLKLIGKKPLVQHIIERLKKCKSLDSIILATSTSYKDKKLLRLAKKLGIIGFAGDENNVLNRFVDAAEKTGAKVIVRICGDNIFIDPKEVDRLVKSHLKTKADYTSNCLDDVTPLVLTGIGFTVEVISFNALKKAFKEANEKSDLEHVTPYIYKNPTIFKLNFIRLPKNLQIKELRLTLDTEEDLENIRIIYSELSKKGFIYPESIIRYINKHPEMLKKMKRINELNKKKV